MSDVRNLWFESHLLSSPAGRAARRSCEALGKAKHESILVHGDRLAQVSIAAAQQFYCHAPGAHERFGRRFDEWVQIGLRLVSADVPARELAVAYFSIDPEAVRGQGVDELRSWTAIAERLAGVSRKLATTFAETTAPFVGHVAGLVLAAWAEAGLSLQGQYGWHGEFLAHAYFANADTALRVLKPSHFGLWAGLGAALRPVMKEAEFFGGLSKRMRSWSEDARAALLRTSLALAVSSPRIAAAFYRDAPAALAELPADLRDMLVGVCRRCARGATGALGEIVPVLGVVLLDVAPAHRGEAMALADRLADEFPSGVPALLRTVATAFEESDVEGVQRWFERGLGIAQSSSESGVAYFALESRTSLKVLHASSTAVLLEEAQGVLRKFVQMLSAQSVVVRSVSTFRLRPPLEEFPLENEVALPLKVDLLDTHEENERLYRVLGAQLAGRREFGTYASSPAPGSEDGPGSALVRYLRAEDRPEILEDLFTVAEGYRIAARLGDEYPGLAREIRWAAEEILRRFGSQENPDAEVVFDCLLAAMLAPDPGLHAAPRWLDGLARVALPVLRSLANDSATVADALAVAEHLARLLAHADVLQASTAADYDELAFERIAGEALLDTYMDEDDAAETVGAADVKPPRPSAKSPDVPEDTDVNLQLGDEDTSGGARPLTLEELRQLLQSGASLQIDQGRGEDIDGLGLYITDLIGKVPSEQLEDLRRLLGESDRSRRRPARGWLERRDDSPCFLYDEWDYHIADYRPRWCRLREVGLDGDSGEFFNRALTQYAAILPDIRRQFQRIRPDMYRMVRGLEDGEDFDLNAAVNARVEARARRSPSPKLYVARKREERDVATLFLIDMSASTDEPLARPGSNGAGEEERIRRPRRIIDVTKEALVVMTEALEEIGDAYAIYGFSGHGRENVEFYLAKSFNEQLTLDVKGRIGGIEPKRSTRMGTALRHAVEKMNAVGSASKHLILLSDGFPQDFDYGQDRRSNLYGIRDTTMALREVEAAGITPFCITVDKAGHDYLREMCDASRYMVIEDITELPRELPKIYQRVVGII